MGNRIITFEQMMDGLRKRRAAARFANAAPVLLAACKEAETVMTIVEPRSHKREYLKALRKLRAAIMKATT